MAQSKREGVSLAKGPVALVGVALLAYGITAFIFGGHSFDAHPISGTVSGKTWLGLEVNAWSSLLFIGVGALLLFASPLHWGAKSLSLVVGLALGAASLIALYDKQDVLGIFAANGLTKLVWGAAATVLLGLAFLPRVGRKKQEAGKRPSRRQPAPTPAPRARVVEREPVRPDREAGASGGAGSRRIGDRVVAPSSGTTLESRETTRRRNGNA